MAPGNRLYNVGYRCLKKLLEDLEWTQATSHLRKHLTPK